MQFSSVEAASRHWLQDPQAAMAATMVASLWVIKKKRVGLPSTKVQETRKKVGSMGILSENILVFVGHFLWDLARTTVGGTETNMQKNLWSIRQRWLSSGSYYISQ